MENDYRPASKQADEKQEIYFAWSIPMWISHKVYSNVNITQGNLASIPGAWDWG